MPNIKEMRSAPIMTRFAPQGSRGNQSPGESVYHPGWIEIGIASGRFSEGLGIEETE